MPTPTEEIKNRLDIVEVITSYVRLHKAGANYKALCPFHSEKTPSFHVSPAKQVWRCFGCEEGGDIFTFIEKIEGLEFREALRLLADRAGVTLRRQDPRALSRREKLRQIMEAATRFYETQLAQNEAARRYLINQRGLNRSTIARFRLGYAPRQWRTLTEHLTGKGFAVADLEAAGLIMSGKNTGRRYDRFRHRIMFPIMTLQDRVIGFSGRLLPEDQPTSAAKYINSPATELYDKSRALFGLNFAKLAIRQAQNALLVEGNLDVVLSHQAGIKNSVAPCGTALTTDQLKTLKRYCDRLLIAFDPDQAGERAARRGVRQALRLGLNVRIVPLPAGQDPADLVKKSPAAWRRQVGRSRDFLEHAFEQLKKRHSLRRVTGKRAFTREFLGLLRSVADPIERGHWLQVMADTLAIDLHFLAEALERTVPPSRPLSEKKSPPGKEKAGPDKLVRLQEALTGLLIEYHARLKKTQRREAARLLGDERLCLIVQSLERADSLKKLSRADQNYAQKLALQAELTQGDQSAEQLSREIKKLCLALKREMVTRKLQALTRQIRRLEQRGASKALAGTLKTYQAALRELARIST